MWEIQLTTEINFITYKDHDEEHTIHSKSDKIEVMVKTKQMKLLKNFLNHFFIDI